MIASGARRLRRIDFKPPRVLLAVAGAAALAVGGVLLTSLIWGVGTISPSAPSPNAGAAVIATDVQIGGAALQMPRLIVLTRGGPEQSYDGYGRTAVLFGNGGEVIATVQLSPGPPQMLLRDSAQQVLAIANGHIDMLDMNGNLASIATLRLVDPLVPASYYPHVRLAADGSALYYGSRYADLSACPTGGDTDACDEWSVRIVQMTDRGFGDEFKFAIPDGCGSLAINPRSGSDAIVVCGAFMNVTVINSSGQPTGSADFSRLQRMDPHPTRSHMILGSEIGLELPDGSLGLLMSDGTVVDESGARQVFPEGKRVLYAEQSAAGVVVASLRDQPFGGVEFPRLGIARWTGSDAEVETYEGPFRSWVLNGETVKALTTTGELVEIDLSTGAAFETGIHVLSVFDSASPQVGPDPIIVD
jgi:hypothetical protein